MTDALLATDNQPSQDATTTPSDAVQVDTQVAPEQQPTETPTETPAPPTETPAEPEKGEAKPAEKPEGPPERYAFERPEGMPEDFQLDSEVETALGDVSRELELSQDNAQKLLSKVWPVLHRRAQEQENAVHEQWIEESKADKEFGGTDFDKSKGIALRAVEAFASDGLRELLRGPLGSQPEVFRLLWKVGQTVSEDGFVSGGQAGQSVDLNDEAAVARALYPNSPQ